MFCVLWNENSISSTNSALHCVQLIFSLPQINGFQFQLSWLFLFFSIFIHPRLEVNFKFSSILQLRQMYAVADDVAAAAMMGTIDGVKYGSISEQATTGTTPTCRIKHLCVCVCRWVKVNWNNFPVSINSQRTTENEFEMMRVKGHRRDRQTTIRIQIDFTLHFIYIMYSTGVFDNNKCMCVSIFVHVHKKCNESTIVFFTSSII